MFSFNAGDGRCPTCGGSGFEHVEMQFLSDVYLRCPDCDGRRYRAEILEVKIDRRCRRRDARARASPTCSTSPSARRCSCSRDDREVVRALQPIVDVGLEYVKLGQPVPTLSGGEAQRLKLAGFLAEAAQSRTRSRARRWRRKGTLFMFDEPTTGLHFDDIAKLMRALRKLLEAGHSLDRHRAQPRRDPRGRLADRPRPGRRRRAAAQVVATGTPEDVKRHAELAHRQGAARLRRALGCRRRRGRASGAPLQLRC